jgi:tRNA threonylcarbamoyl adenosine modification protein YeaZ/ribosomal-protein-alanine acetyltransferase
VDHGLGAAVRGLAIESATARLEVAVCDASGRPLRVESLEAAHGHVRELMPLVRRTLEASGTRPRDLAWVAADLGPGSFTGLRVGLATARALALAAGARVRGATSLAALAHAVRVRHALVVPLVPAGRRELYAGFFRSDARGQVSLLAAPAVGEVAALMPAVEECRRLLGRALVRFIGPGAAREAAYRGSAQPVFRGEGLSAADLAAAALSEAGPAAGLPRAGEELTPLYVRGAQAEERVRRRVTAAHPPLLRTMTAPDVVTVAQMEREVFPDPWPASFFLAELGQPLVYPRVAEQDGRLVGYMVAWLGVGTGHLGNIAVAPHARRRGVARALLDDLLERARALRVENLTLEVRVSNFGAQQLYRIYGFRLAGLRRGYYRDSGEDALIMEWRQSA